MLAQNKNLFINLLLLVGGKNIEFAMFCSYFTYENRLLMVFMYELRVTESFKGISDDIKHYNKTSPYMSLSYKIPKQFWEEFKAKAVS